jgi:hypothetical protein
MTPETLKDVTPEKPAIPPCNIRYITVGYARLDSGRCFWCSNYHDTPQKAQADFESFVPGTGRIFEIPQLPAIGPEIGSEK